MLAPSAPRLVVEPDEHRRLGQRLAFGHHRAAIEGRVVHAGQHWPERYWGDHCVVNDWGVVHLLDPGVGYRWHRDDDGNYVRVAAGSHVIEEVYVH